MGYQDGVVLLTKLEETSDAIVIRGSTGAEVTAIASFARRVLCLYW